MRIQKIILISLTLVYLGALQPACVFAVDNSEMLQERNVQKAINRFARSLQLNPAGKTALENLRLIAAYPNLTAKQRSQVYLLEDLLHYINNLKERIGYLTEKRSLLIEKLKANGYETDMFSKDLFEAQPMASSQYSQESFLAEKEPLLFVSDRLTFESERLSARLESLQEQYQWLKKFDYGPLYGFSQDLTAPASVTPAVSENVIRVSGSDYARRDVNNQYSQRPRSLAITAKPIIVTPKITDEVITIKDDRKEEGVVLRGDRHSSKDDLKQRDARIDGLSQQVVDLSERISQIEVLLDEKIGMISSLKSELNEVQQRFKLEQRLIQEKNVKLMNELKGILEIYKLKLGEENRSSREKAQSIVDLQGQLSDLRSELHKKNETLTRTENELLKLKGRYEQNKLHDPEAEHKALELQSKFQDIQHFLLENPRGFDKINTHQVIQ